MISRKFYNIITIAVTSISSCFFMTSCENNINEVKALSSREGGIDVGKEVEIYISTGGRISAKLMAPLMNKYLLDSGKMIEFPKTIKVNFFKDSSTEVESKLSANYARFIEADSKVFLRDNVVVYNVLGDTLWCNEMVWDQQTGKFHTDKGVIVKQHAPLSKVWGKGFEADQNLKDIKIIDVQSNSFAILSDSTGTNP
jgi:LPS export ABC transporter protein LptC